MSRLLCAGAASTSAAGSRQVSLVLQRSLRQLLPQPKKSITLTLAPDKPLATLRSGLAARLVQSHLADGIDIRHGRRTVGTDTELLTIISRCEEAGVQPTLRAVATADRPLPPPAPPEEGPALSTRKVACGPLRLVSFFRFVPLAADERAALVDAIHGLLHRLGVHGSVYVAPEGLNGQLSVPISSLVALRRELPAVAGLDELRFNEQHAALGTVHASAPGAPRPYRKLVVREKRQILTDGLLQPTEGGGAGGGGAGGGGAAGGGDGGGGGGGGGAATTEEGTWGATGHLTLDWQHAGTELSAEDWHRMLSRVDAGTESGAGADATADATAAASADAAAADGHRRPLLLDVRNSYETAVGTFEGAEPLETATFSQSWDALRERLDGVPVSRLASGEGGDKQRGHCYGSARASIGLRC